MNILVLCTGNSARSILLESILNARGAGRVTAFSAGSQPAGRVHPEALALLAAKGHDTQRLTSKSWDIYAAPDAPRMELVITVCGNAEQSCPIWPGAPLRAHWGLPDPAAAATADQSAAFAETYARLDRMAAAFLALPFEALPREELAERLATIGKNT